MIRHKVWICLFVFTLTLGGVRSDVGRRCLIAREGWTVHGNALNIALWETSTAIGRRRVSHGLVTEGAARRTKSGNTHTQRGGAINGAAQ